VVPVAGFTPTALQEDDLLRITDTRDADRSVEVVAVHEDGVWCEARSTAYVAPGTRLRRAPGNGRGELELVVGEVPMLPRALLLREGDLLELTRELVPGQPAEYDADGTLLRAARVGCTLADIFDDARVGDRIWFDDGLIGGEILSVSNEHLTVRITEAPPRGGRLQAEKGINLPDTDLSTPALTSDDLDGLRFAAQHADIVALSFVRDPSDVLDLQQQLARLGRPEMPIIVKVETRKAFEQLPELLLTAMRSPVVGVMIARGDLAVECGFERLAELQEETLWLCEAAHVPAIWATQVLETLARTGIASRAEITDAAMGERAECVMLNKGPFIVRAIQTLDDILRRMEGHQRKKVSLLRRLRSWSLATA
jgi:pyruvate kinase